MHNRGALEDDQLSRTEWLTYFDQDEASIVPVVLANDPDFQAKSRVLAAVTSSERLEAAERVARDYVPNQSVARDMVVNLLLYAAEEPWRWRGATPVEFFGNLQRPAFWCESPLDDLDGRRAKPRWETLKQGARAFARFGAGRCLNCGNRLSGDAAKRPRRPHCRRCEAELPAYERESHIDAKRQALDAWTGQRRRHRSARRGRA